MKKIIGITGYSGVLGKYFSKRYNHYEFDVFSGDITLNKDVREWINKTNANYILHFASKVSTDFVNKNYENSLKVNYLGTKNLVDNIIKSKKKIWLFFSSTSHVYKFKKQKIKESDKTEPISLYGKTKKKAENYLIKISNKNNIKICIGRIFSFTDKNQKEPYLIPSLLKKLSNKKKKIMLENLNHERDFCHIDDICRAVNMLRKKKSVGIFNIGTGKSVNLLDIVKIINKNKKIISFKKNKVKTKLVANISKIKKIGFNPKFDIKKIVLDLI